MSSSSSGGSHQQRPVDDHVVELGAGAAGVGHLGVGDDFAVGAADCPGENTAKVA